MELHEALSQIAEIRRQVARVEVFRGFRAAPVAATGLLALLTGAVQAATVVDPVVQIERYLTLWIGAAALGALVAGTGIALRTRLTSAARRRITWLALEQFVPCLVAGALVTLVIVRNAPEAAWILPGLWQVLFSLGIVASRRLLPRPMLGVGVFYMATGLSCLAWARGPAVLSPWWMALPFGVGQLLAAAILYWTLERHDAEA